MEEECKRCKLCPQPRLDRRCLFFNLCRGWNLTSLVFFLEAPLVSSFLPWGASEIQLVNLEKYRWSRNQQARRLSAHNCLHMILSSPKVTSLGIRKTLMKIRKDSQGVREESLRREMQRRPEHSFHFSIASLLFSSHRD